MAERRSVPLDLGGDGQYDSPGFRARYIIIKIHITACHNIVFSLGIATM